MAEVAVGIDVGGTFAKIAAVSASGRILRLDQIPTEARRGPGPFMRRLCEALRGWRRSGLAFLGAGVGLAGDVDSARGVLRFAPNLREWEGYDFKKGFARRLRTRAIIENDANAAVWGAYVMELKKRPLTVVGLTLGTGVGGGLIVHGKLHRGASGCAGEIGHTLVEPDGEPCHCGARGCLEAYVGRYAIIRTARRLMAGRRTLLAAGSLEPADLAAAAEKGDKVAREVWARVARYLAVGLSNLVMIVNPEVILLLGGVSRAGRWLMDPLRRHLARRPFRTPFRRLAFRAADNPQWGCVGAALLALEEDRSRG